MSFTSTQLRQHPTLRARCMEVTTPHGSFTTPTFMPVGTRAAVNCMNATELENTGSQIILGGNTYHMLVNPGTEFIEQAGGMHSMMGWDAPMLTDSGGFQVFSLSKNSQICKIDDNGAHFKHPNNGQLIHLTPQTSISTQKSIGADIIMVFDECTPEIGGHERAVKALERTHRWLFESIETHQKNTRSVYGHEQALFGIIQGGSFQDLREKSTSILLDAELDGYAIGGEVIGFDMDKTDTILDWITPALPTDKVRYTMGVGLNPDDLIRVVAKGIDIFDCVAPTRNARHGALYHGHTVLDKDWVRYQIEDNTDRILIKKACYANDNRPILKDCDCYTCQHYSRSYLHFLFKTKQALYASLACIHNVRVMQKTCEIMQTAI